MNERRPPLLAKSVGRSRTSLLLSVPSVSRLRFGQSVAIMSVMASLIRLVSTLVLCCVPCSAVCGIAGSTCSVDGDCSGLDNGVCKSGVCDCPASYYPIPGEYYCANIKIGSPCNPLAVVDTCRDGVTGSVCDSDYGYCRCPPGYRNVVTDASNQCVQASVVTAQCEQCNATGGVCYVPTTTGQLTCGCPEYYQSSGLAQGCNIKYSYTGNVCGGSSQITCVDPNAQCAYAGDLSHGYFCQCKLGYVAVPRSYDPKHADCYRIVNKVLDTLCQACDDNGGVCYWKDNVHGGCLCPPTRTSSSTSPNDYCNVIHFDISCDGTDSPTVCYRAAGNAMHQHILTKLQQGVARLYVLGLSDNPACYFTNSTIGGDFCLTLQPDNTCNTLIQNTTQFVSFSNWFVLQRNARFLSSNDYSLHAFCTYDILAHASTGLVEVAQKQIVGTEGTEVKPSLFMAVYDRFGDNIKMEGIVLGDEIMLKIGFLDTKGIYTALRAEVCLVSNLLSLSHPQVQSVLFIMNSCPADNCLLPTATNFYPEGPVIRTGYFPAPKFDRTDYIYFHCAVRVCITASQCSALDCSPRNKRSTDSIRVGSVALPHSIHDLVQHPLIKRSTDASMFDVSRAMESNELTHQTVAIKVRDPEQPKERYTLPNAAHHKDAAPVKGVSVNPAHLQQDDDAAGYSHMNEIGDRYQRPPVQDGASSVLLVSVLTALVLTLLGAALVLCYILPRRAVVEAKTQKGDMS